jgi:hypothetical protein
MEKRFVSIDNDLNLLFKYDYNIKLDLLKESVKLNQIFLHKLVDEY